MHSNAWSRVWFWRSVMAISMYFLLAICLAGLVHALAQYRATYRLAEFVYEIPSIATWYRWVPHEGKLGDIALLRDVMIVNQFPTLLALLMLIGLVGVFATKCVRDIRARVRHEQAVSYDERLRERERERPAVVVNVPERSAEMEQLKNKLEKLEGDNEALLTVLKEALQKDEPPPKKRPIGFV